MAKVNFRDYLLFAEAEKYKKSTDYVSLCHINELCDNCRFRIDFSNETGDCTVVTRKCLVK